MPDEVSNTIMNGRNDFERLSRAIRAGNGFRLLLAEYNLPHYRDLIIRRLKTLHGRSLVYPVDRENPPDFNAIKQRLAELSSDAGVLHVLGLEAWNHDPETDWLPSLNVHRENLARRCPLPLVIWLPGRLIRLLAIHAADVWSWRSGVFDFSVRTERDKPESDLIPGPQSTPGSGKNA
jgi:hypothetical protein